MRTFRWRGGSPPFPSGNGGWGYPSSRIGRVERWVPLRAEEEGPPPGPGTGRAGPRSAGTPREYVHAYMQVAGRSPPSSYGTRGLGAPSSRIGRVERWVPLRADEGGLSPPAPRFREMVSRRSSRGNRAFADEGGGVVPPPAAGGGAGGHFTQRQWGEGVGTPPGGRGEATPRVRQIRTLLLLIFFS